MPPISIDGTDITGATIDGTDVTEITVDGQTVFTAGLPDSVALNYNFESGSGSTLVDSVGTNNGSISSGSFTSDAAVDSFAFSFASGLNATSDNSDDFIGDGQSGFVGIAGWVKSVSNDTGYLAVLHQDGSGATDDFLAIFLTGGSIEGFSREGGGGGNFIDSGITAQSYTHVYTEFDGSNIDIFINGTNVTSGTSEDISNLGPMNVLLGARADGSGSLDSAVIDDLMIIDSPLSSNELNEIISRGP